MSNRGTIIIPAHNEERFIMGLLESLKKYLTKPTQIIVVANGCSDSTAITARKYGCNVIETSQKEHPSSARNQGVKSASGEILAFLDADTEVTEKWCSTFQELLDASKGDHLYLTGDQYQVSKVPAWIEKNWFLPLSKLPKNYINGGNLIVSRKLFYLIGGFDANLETGEDVDFCRRAKKASAEFVMNPSFVVLHEGFPKSIRHFIKRERWHGKGDFQGLSYLLRSKTALITLTFLLIHFFFFISLMFTTIDSSAFNIGLSITLAISLLAITAITCSIRFRSIAVLSRPSILAIQYLYFVGRSLSAFDSVTKIWNCPRSKISRP